jgi:hypothetical protein
MTLPQVSMSASLRSVAIPPTKDKEEGGNDDHGNSGEAVDESHGTRPD